MRTEFLYAQARAQARVGKRISEAEWRAMDATDDLGHYLGAIRTTPLASIVQEHRPTSSPHAIERSLREAWSAEVDHVCRWVPEAWRDRVAWTRWLPYLPALGHLANGGAPLPWMPLDPILAAFAADEPDERRHAFAESEIDELAAIPVTDPFDWWRRQWLELFPDPEGLPPSLQALDELLAAYLGSMARAGPGRNAASETLDEFEQQVIRLLHTHSGEPAAVFCHLALAAVELGRLRSGLVRRSLGNASPSGERP